MNVGYPLDPEFEIYITKFKDVYMGLGISITLKVHILTDTFQNFVEVIIILQAYIQSRHQRVAIMIFLRNGWEKQGYKRSLGHTDYAKNLKAAVIAYSSKTFCK